MAMGSASKSSPVAMPIMSLMFLCRGSIFLSGPVVEEVYGRSKESAYMDRGDKTGESSCEAEWEAGEA
jgi:hypothetical protein